MRVCKRVELQQERLPEPHAAHMIFMVGKPLILKNCLMGSFSFAVASTWAEV